MQLSDFPVDGSVTIVEFVELYCFIRARHLRSSYAVSCSLHRMARRLPVQRLCDLRRSDVSQYIASRLALGRTVRTVNVELLIFSAALNYARNHWGWQIDNPISGQFLREPPGRVRFLYRHEFSRLVDACSRLPGVHGDTLPDFARLAVNTGMRKTELLMLRWDQINGDRLTLEPEHTKNCRRRIVPLNESARAVLARRRGRSSFVLGPIKGLYPAWHQACKMADIEDFRIHDLRHTFASWLVLAGVPLLQVRDLLGHSSIKMTERYSHLTQEALFKAVAVLDQELV